MFVKCELCFRSFDVKNMRMFRLSYAGGGTIFHERDNRWEGKQGVRHLCVNCCHVVSVASETPINEHRT